jgi:hypothetical protein
LLLAGCPDPVMDRMPLDFGDQDLAGADFSGGGGDGGGPVFDLSGDGADTVGPVITIESPKGGSFVSGIIEVRASIKDKSAIKSTSVVAVFANDPSKYSLTLIEVSPGANTYNALFDTNKLDENIVLPSLSVRADDVVGNHGETAEVLVIDHVRPQIELDPAPMRVFKKTMSTVTCGAILDPVGTEAANDGQKVPQVITLRARIEDRGNQAPGLQTEYISGVDDSSVNLFARPTDGMPLVVDTDGDGLCDEVNPLLTPTTAITSSNQALAVKMANIPAGGKVDYSNSAEGTPTPPWSTLGCTEYGVIGATKPDKLCKFVNTSITFIIAPAFGGSAGAIWGIPPVASNDFECVGYQLDSLNTLPEGPLCATVRVQDKAGNVNVAPPLRLCVDRGGSQCTTWPPATLPTSCTGKYDKNTMQIVSGTCTPWQTSKYSTTFLPPDRLRNEAP